MKNQRGLPRCFPFLVATLLLAASLPAMLQQEDAAGLLKTADDVARTVARLRNLEIKTSIEKGIQTREEISAYLHRHVKENYNEDELRGEGRILQKLGLIPPDLDYRSFMLKLLGEQVGGYYDPEIKKFFIAGWLPVDQQKPVMAHELMHALQDQHFDLARLVKESMNLENDDQQLARQAIFEGDAMAVMLDFILEPAGRTFATLPDLVFVMRAQMSAMDSQYDIFRQAPAFIKETLLFPYGYGAAFLQKVRAAEPWSAVDKIYADLPLSTEQVIHPEKYTGSRDVPTRVEIRDPAVRLGAPWKISYRTVLGEFTLFVLLKNHLPEERARRAAAGWDGDAAVLVEGSGDAAFVALDTVWDTADDAEEFFLAMKEWLRLSRGEGTAREQPLPAFSVVKSGEVYSVEREGETVRCYFGLPAAEADKLKR